MINLQNGSVPTPVDAIEIDKAVLDLQTRLSASLSWLSHGYGKTYRNIDVSQGLTVYFPEVFLGNNAYMRVTPDNDKQGQSLILVGNEEVLDNDLGQNSHLQYDVSIIFTANLKLINSTLLETEYYQQNLIRDVRHVLQSATLGAFYQITMDSIDRDFTDVWREFNIEEKRGISHAPFTHFRVNCTVTLKEDCVTAPFDRCATILNMTTQAEQECLANALNGGQIFDSLVDDASAIYSTRQLIPNAIKYIGDANQNNHPFKILEIVDQTSTQPNLKTYAGSSLITDYNQSICEDDGTAFLITEKTTLDHFISINTLPTAGTYHFSTKFNNFTSNTNSFYASIKFVINSIVHLFQYQPNGRLFYNVQNSTGGLEFRKDLGDFTGTFKTVIMTTTSNDTVTIYIDGVPVYVRNETTSFNPTFNIEIGDEASIHSFWFDDLFFFNRILNISEVKRLYDEFKQ